MSSSTTKTVVIAALALVVTFIAGFVVGAVVDRFVMFEREPRRPPPLATEAMLHRLDRRLDLTDQQREQIEQILERRHERIHQLMQTTRPQVHREVEAANAEIERLLTPEQREKFKDMKMRLGPRGRRPSGGRRP